MKIIRFEDQTGSLRYGEPIDASHARLLEGDLFGLYRMGSQTAEVKRLLAPVQPVNILAIGLNYRRHAAESGKELPTEPFAFVKLTTSLNHPGDPIILPASAPDEVDFESELAIVIGKKAKNVPEADALKYVLGYTCAIDVSARDCQIRRDNQWYRAKGFDTFCPLGPCLLVDPAASPNALTIRGRLNGKIMQESNTSDMIFTVQKIVSFLSHQVTLLPSTVILTGTPEGVGCARRPPVYLRPGDVFTVEIDGIGELKSPVQADR